MDLPPYLQWGLWLTPDISVTHPFSPSLSFFLFLPIQIQNIIRQKHLLYFQFSVQCHNLMTNTYWYQEKSVDIMLGSNRRQYTVDSKQMFNI